MTALKIAVRDSAVTQVLGYLANPLGRRIPDNVKTMSDWFKNLGAEDKLVLSMILTYAVDGTMLRLFSVFDGAIANEERPSKGRLGLYYEDNSGRSREITGKTLRYELY